MPHPVLPSIPDEAEIARALDIARSLASFGVPIFVAPADPSHRLGVRLPSAWQHTPADPTTIDRWTPGDALCAVMGHTVDGLDRDTHKGGVLDSITEPTSYGRQATPSGGTHDLIAPLGVHSRDGVLPGVDVKAGTEDGGRGFLFIAPTVRTSKVTGEVLPYRWTTEPDLAPLLLEDDPSGEALADAVLRVSSVTATPSETGYTGPAYDELDEEHQKQASHYVGGIIDGWRERLDEAAEWPDGARDDRGRGWESLVRDLAWALAMLAAAPWAPMSETDAFVHLDALLPAEMVDVPALQGKLTQALFDKAAGKPVDLPPWEKLVEDFGPAITGSGAWPEIPTSTDDASLIAWVAARGLDGRWCYSGGVGWRFWDGRRWVDRGEHDAREALRVVALDLCATVVRSGLPAAKVKAFLSLRTTGRLSSLTQLLKGVTSVDGESFDTHADLLNVGNGIVDLRTGELQPHDPTLMMSKISEIDFVPGATHDDWSKVLTCLEPEVMDWMQVRAGQAATGHPTSDDILPICVGGGENGKSTFIEGLARALGQHATKVPEKLLRAGAGDHPTELMTLQGARLALIDETPEAGQLNVARLKAVLGQESMTARAIRKDNVTWQTSHSLFVTTNHVPRVVETDHGTWRRLVQVSFEKKYPRDDSFRARINAGAGGIAEAALAWIVQGAKRWYDEGRIMPPAPAKVAEDTKKWRGSSDLVVAYIEDRLVFDPEACVTSTDFLDDVNEWLRDRRHREWSDQLVAARFGTHEEFMKNGVAKTRPKSPRGVVSRSGIPDPSGRPTVWSGIRWADSIAPDHAAL